MDFNDAIRAFKSEEVIKEAANDNLYRDTALSALSDSVGVFFPSGNSNQLTELGRYKSLEVAMKILSSINHPDNTFQIPEYKIFSLETGTEIFVH